MQLADCPNVWGYATVLDVDPRIEIHKDVLFVPGGKGGLFDRGRRLIAGSGYYRGLPSALGVCDLVHGSVFSPVDPDSIIETLDETVVFGGVLIAHFGHFLVGTLSRFWNSDLRAGYKHLVINGDDIAPYFQIPFYNTIMPTLDLRASNFLSLAKPTRIREAVVVYPSFEENNLVHSAYGRLCKEIADKLCTAAHKQIGPVFLSKSKVKSGITLVENESELCERLARRGVEIVYPETLNFAEQISIFKSSKAISGFMGSAFHLSAFAPGCRLMAINHSPDIISNQVMIDKIAGNQARYVFNVDMLTAYGANEKFHRVFRLNNIEETEEKILRYFDSCG